jgi:hypothetical protein
VPRIEAPRKEAEERMDKPLLAEIRESIFLILLMAGMLVSYLGLGLLAVRVLG